MSGGICALLGGVEAADAVGGRAVGRFLSDVVLSTLDIDLFRIGLFFRLLMGGCWVRERACCRQNDVQCVRKSARVLAVSLLHSFF